MRAGGHPVVVAQWQNTGCTSQVSWVRFPAAAGLFTFLITSKLSLFQREPKVLSTQYMEGIHACMQTLLIIWPCKILNLGGFHDLIEIFAENIQGFSASCGAFQEMKTPAGS